MNKKVLIGIVAVILIVAIGIVAGKKFGKSDSENTNTNSNEGANTSISTPNIEETATPEVELTPTPEEIIDETPTPVNMATPTQNSSKVDITNLSPSQKIEYAKKIAKQEWEKLDADVKVHYNFDKELSGGKYLISVRDEETKALAYYTVDVEKGTWEVNYSH